MLFLALADLLIDLPVPSYRHAPYLQGEVLNSLRHATASLSPESFVGNLDELVSPLISSCTDAVTSKAARNGELLESSLTLWRSGPTKELCDILSKEILLSLSR